MFHRASGLYFFTFRGIDVRVSFWYLVLMALIVFSPGGATTPMAETVAHGLNFASALTLSLLVHEFGHALVSQYYRLRPSILLHGFGGLCMHESASTDGRDARILLAGPGAGLVLGILS
ncbi:MAG: hypothetical protein ABEL76_07285, partial [Bradymonadaceae bacterium]